MHGLGPRAPVQGLEPASPPVSPQKRSPTSSSPPPSTGEADQLRKQTAMMEG